MERSTYLFPTPSFAEGIARLFDFLGTMNIYNLAQGVDPDALGISLDWAAIGDEMKKAIVALAEAHPELLAAAS